MKITPLIILFGILSLVGCAGHSHYLTSESDPHIVRGQFTHESGTHLVIETASKRYEAGNFAIRTTMNREELRKHYQNSSPKHWERIKSGMDRDHLVYFSEPVLKSQDGDELKCKFSWRSGQAPSGSCFDKSRKEYAVVFD